MAPRRIKRIRRMNGCVVVPLPRSLAPEECAHELRRRGVSRRILVVET